MSLTCFFSRDSSFTCVIFSSRMLTSLGADFRFFFYFSTFLCVWKVASKNRMQNTRYLGRSHSFCANLQKEHRLLANVLFISGGTCVFSLFRIPSHEKFFQIFSDVGAHKTTESVSRTSFSFSGPRLRSFASRLTEGLEAFAFT